MEWNFILIGEIYGINEAMLEGLVSGWKDGEQHGFFDILADA